MRRRVPVVSYWVLFSVFVVLLWSSHLRGQVPDAPGGISSKLPRLASDSIPSPPRQSDTWKAPETRLSKEFVSATVTLFQLGLADPRGCEYREIEVVVCGFEPPWSDAVAKTHGWVLPNGGKPAQRFGVCWNGLVYPLVSIGKAADLRRDALRAAKAPAQPALYGTGRYWKPYGDDFGVCHAWEGRTVAHDSPLLIKACLLLRLGEAELAQKLCDRWTSELRTALASEQSNPAYDRDYHFRTVETLERNLKDPYLVLANSWTLSLFDRAVAGHLRGDDRLALITAEMLGSAWPRITAEAAIRGFSRPSREKLEEGALYLLLDPRQAGELLADQWRRARERRQGTAPPVLSGDYPESESSTVLEFSVALGKEIARCSDKNRRVDLLVRELEEITSDNSPAVFVVNEGDDAVEPLLRCVDSDTRLSRCPGREERYPMPVYPFAEQALRDVLKMPFEPNAFDDSTPKEGESKRRARQVAKIRGYWNRYKGLPLVERCFLILADDRAEPEHWLDAARTIVQPAYVGDALRNKASPGVTELMAKRIESLSAPYFESLRRGEKLDELQSQIDKLEERLQNMGEKQGKAASKEFTELQRKKDALVKTYDELSNEQDDLDALLSGCDMALYLAQWDPAAALPHLRRLTAICQKAGGAPQADGSQDCSERMVGLVLARAAAGDFSGLDEYAVWVRDAQPTRLWYSFRRNRVFEPLCRYPDRPALAKAAEWLFNDKASPWYPILVRDEWQKQLSLDALSSPLLAVPAFRKRVLQLLEDRQEVGHVTVTSSAKIGLGLDRDRETSTIPDDPLCPPPGNKTAFRVCDACAFGLSPVEGTPRCELYWPEKHRDRTVAACAAMLRQYGHRFRVGDKVVDGDGFPLEPISGTSDRHSVPLHLTFPLLGHPATPDDVRRGEAIFSLAGQGSVRVPRTPKLPRNARWKMLKDYPFLEDTWDPSGAWKKTVGYRQEGIVWQAEEIEVAGRWQRYYGFVGRFGVAKVPEEEIEFPTGPWQVEEWLTLDPDIRIRLEAAPGAEERCWVMRSEDSEYFPPMLFYGFGQPMVFKVVAHNLAGTDRLLPTLSEGVQGKTPNGRIPMSLRLRYCEKPPTVSCVRSIPGPALMYRIVGMPWTEVPRTIDEQLIADNAGRSLGPAEHVDYLKIDLPRLFGVIRPGTYWLSLKLFGGKNDAAQENEIIFAVTEKADKRPTHVH